MLNLLIYLFIYCHEHLCRALGQQDLLGIILSGECVPEEDPISDSQKVLDPVERRSADGGSPAEGAAPLPALSCCKASGSLPCAWIVRRYLLVGRD